MKKDRNQKQRYYIIKRRLKVILLGGVYKIVKGLSIIKKTEYEFIVLRDFF